MKAHSQKIVLAGRTFVRAGVSTVEHDIEFVRLLRSAGIGEAKLLEGETPEDFAWRMLQALIEAKALLPLVACLIVPEEHARPRSGALVRFLARLGFLALPPRHRGWSVELQAETVAFLQDLDEPEDKQRVYALVAELLVPFLNGVLASWRSSPRSSGLPAEPPPSAEAGGPSAAATSHAGESSSGNSPGTTLTATPAFSNGHSPRPSSPSRPPDERATWSSSGSSS